MSYDLPDFYRIRSRGPLYPLTDLAELAARLGSIVTFDRRGDVVWFDDFESGLSAWQKSESGAGSGVDWDGNVSRSGGFSAKYTLDSSAANVALFRIFPVPVLGKIGMEISFTINSNLSWFQFLSSYYDSANVAQFGIRYNNALGQLEYLNSSGSWIEIPDLNIRAPYVSKWNFNTLKMVFDLEKTIYTRILFNELAADLTEAPSTAVSSQPARLDIYMRAREGASGESLYADDYILTQNEP